MVKKWLLGYEPRNLEAGARVTEVDEVDTRRSHALLWRSGRGKIIFGSENEARGMEVRGKC